MHEIQVSFQVCQQVSRSECKRLARQNLGLFSSLLYTQCLGQSLAHWPMKPAGQGAHANSVCLLSVWVSEAPAEAGRRSRYQRYGASRMIWLCQINLALGDENVFLCINHRYIYHTQMYGIFALLEFGGGSN